MILTHPIPLCVLPTLLGAIPLIGALVIARKRPTLFVALALLTVLLQATVGSYYWSQRVTVGEQGITESKGWWFDPTITEFEFSRIQSISIEARGVEGKLNWIWHISEGPRSPDPNSAAELARRLEALTRPASQPTTQPSTQPNATQPAEPSPSTRAILFDPDDVWDLHCAEIMRTMIESGIEIEFDAEALPDSER